MRTHFEMIPSQGFSIKVSADTETDLITIDAFNAALDADELAIFQAQLDFADGLVELFDNKAAPAPEDETVYEAPELEDHYGDELPEF